MKKKFFLVVTAFVVVIAALAVGLAQTHDSNANSQVRNIRGSIGHASIVVVEVDGQKFLVVRCADGVGVAKF